MVNIKSDQIAAMPKYYRIFLINSLVGNKSLNLLGTINTDNISNLSVMNSAFSLCANPPLLGLVTKPEPERYNILRDIMATGQYTLNNVLPDFFRKDHQTGAEYPSRISGLNDCGFKVQYADGFKAPFVKQSTIQIGLELRETINMKTSDSTIVVGEIIEIITADSIISLDGTVDHAKAESMTSAGIDAYFLPRAVARLAYAKPGTELEEFSLLN